jgi:hypothetical protein
MAWRVAKSLLTLRDQINAMAPGRSTSSDGTIGDAAHQATNSDHNPNADGVVTAMDITHDPSHGVDAGKLAEMLRVSRDQRIKYVISQRRIFSSKVSPWQWRPYTGVSPHTEHVHISVDADRSLYDDTRPWAVDGLMKPSEVPREAAPGRNTRITATVFGGRADPNNSFYDNKPITDEELGVALPYRFPGTLPLVRVINIANSKSVVCKVRDIGPWNTDDSYWQTGSRPEAESGVDSRGRITNHAGIDLTPAAAAAIGIDGKGLVDWEFAQADDVPIPKPKTPGGPDMPTPSPTNELVTLIQQIQAILATLNKQPSQPQSPVATPPTADSQDQLQKIISILVAVMNAGGAGSAAGTAGTAGAAGAQTGAANPPLGPVNGALGQTIGNLLNGSKSAIGIIGALASQILQVPATGSLGGSLIPFLGTAVAPYATPIFLAIAAWGVLGKFEKWTQAAAPGAVQPSTNVKK